MSNVRPHNPFPLTHQFPIDASSNLMIIALSIILFGLLCVVGIYAGRYFTRYSTAVASDMGSDISRERKGPVDDSGMTAFDRELFWDVVLGNYRSASTDTLRLGRIARTLLGATVAVLILFIAWLNHVGVGQ